MTPSGHHGLQPVNLDLFLDLSFEIRDRGMKVVGDEVRILVFADELSTGKQRLGERPGLHSTAKIRVAYLEAETVGFLEQNLALDQRLRCLRHDVGKHHIRIVLLLQNPFRNLLHFGSGNRGSGAEVAAHESSAMHRSVGVGGGIGIGHDARHERDHHGANGNSNDDDEDDLDETVVFGLQETNHWVIATFIERPFKYRAIQMAGLLAPP